MTTVTLWLLISLGRSSTKDYATPTVTVERFVSSQECERVRQVIDNSLSWGSPALRCIQATVAR